MGLEGPGHKSLQTFLVNNMIPKRWRGLGQRTGFVSGDSSCLLGRFRGFTGFGGAHGSARDGGVGKKGVELDSGGGHRVDDCVIHHDSSDGGEDVTTDQASIFIETISAIGPLFDTRSIAEGFVLQRLI